MPNCTLCVRGPDDAHDSIYCHEVGHRVYHDTRACRAFVAKDAPQQQSVCRPMGLGLMRQCPACKSLFICNGKCQQCGHTL
jgi:hypothetical protein